MIQELNTKGRCETRFEIFNTFSNIKAFFSKMDKKGIAKNRSDFSKRRFFCSNKWRRQTEQDKMCPPKNKKNKEIKVKHGEKGDEKNEDRKIQEEDKNQGRNKKRRKEREREKGSRKEEMTNQRE